MTCFEEFKKAYDSYPSQDNEGFVPDRAGFKCGFLSAWITRQEEINRLSEKLDKWRSILEINHDHLYPQGKCEICDLLRKDAE